MNSFKLICNINNLVPILYSLKNLKNIEKKQVFI